ncbi:hypothetical protein COOONC_08621 [Cooperia oncophora]
MCTVRDVVARATALTPTEAERTTVAALLLKVKAAIEKVMTTPDCVPGVRFEEYREVGSFKKDTALTGHTVADVVIIMQTLPTFEAVAALGNKLAEELRAQKEGIFLPGSPTLFDPTEPGMRIAYDLSFEDMDLVCSTAQTLLRVICNGGHAAVLGMDPSKLGVDLSKEVSIWNGVAVSPLEVAYVEDCMKPKFCEADEALEIEARA